METPRTIIASKGMNFSPLSRIKYQPYKKEIARREFLRICEQLYENFEQTVPFMDVVDLLIPYVHGDENDFRGIGLIGPTGARKTFIMEAMRRYIAIDDVKYIRNDRIISFSFSIVPSLQIISEFSESGFMAIDRFSNLNIICIDDLGTESPTATHYGNKVNVIEQIIEQRYMMRKITHFTSNFTMDKIHELYGDRVYSRLMQTTNVITLSDIDFRLKK